MKKYAKSFDGSVWKADQRDHQKSQSFKGVSLGIVDAQADGSLKYDLQAISPGAYTWTATAKNTWGTSAPSDPYVSPTGSTAPQGMGLVP